MVKRFTVAPILVLAFTVLLFANRATAEMMVRFDTVMGNIDVKLHDDTPATRDNFLAYVTNGTYTESIIHRSTTVASAGVVVVQGGGFLANNSFPPDPVTTLDPVVNEPKHSNVRGTIAMARSSGVNSATSQWYFNVVDNTALDTINDGFTVFGEVMGNGMDVVDFISAIQRFNGGGAFAEIPLKDFANTSLPTNENYIMIHGVSVMPVPEPSSFGLVTLGSLFLLRRRVR